MLRWMDKSPITGRLMIYERVQIFLCVLAKEFKVVLTPRKSLAILYKRPGDESTGIKRGEGFRYGRVVGWLWLETSKVIIIAEPRDSFDVLSVRQVKLWMNGTPIGEIIPKPKPGCPPCDPESFEQCLSCEDLPF